MWSWVVHKDHLRDGLPPSGKFTHDGADVWIGRFNGNADIDMRYICIDAKSIHQLFAIFQELRAPIVGGLPCESLDAHGRCGPVQVRQVGPGSPAHPGLGVFAIQEIPKGAVVAVYSHGATVVVRGSDLDNFVFHPSNGYGDDISGNILASPAPFTNSYANTGMQPNARFREEVVGNRLHVCIVASRRISAGEEILICYGPKYFELQMTSRRSVDRKIARVRSSLGLSLDVRERLLDALIRPDLRTLGALVSSAACDPRGFEDCMRSVTTSASGQNPISQGWRSRLAQIHGIVDSCPPGRDLDISLGELACSIAQGSEPIASAIEALLEDAANTCPHPPPQPVATYAAARVAIAVIEVDARLSETVRLAVAAARREDGAHSMCPGRDLDVATPSTTSIIHATLRCMCAHELVRDFIIVASRPPHESTVRIDAFEGVRRISGNKRKLDETSATTRSRN